MNIEGKLFYEDVENVDYSVNRNKVFLQLDDGTSYDDLNKISNNEVNMTYQTTYEVCKPYSSGTDLIQTMILIVVSINYFHADM